MTSKLQVTIPKAVAVRYGIRPGTDVSFEPSGEAIWLRVGEERDMSPEEDKAWRLRMFDAASERQKRRADQQPAAVGGKEPARGWTREELYERGRRR